MKKCSQSVQLIEKENVFFFSFAKWFSQSNLSLSPAVFQFPLQSANIPTNVTSYSPQCFPLASLQHRGLTKHDLRESKHNCHFRVESAEKKPKGIDVARMWNWFFLDSKKRVDFSDWSQAPSRAKRVTYEACAAMPAGTAGWRTSAFPLDKGKACRSDGLVRPQLKYLVEWGTKKKIKL